MLSFIPARTLVLAFLALALFATLGISGDTAPARGERADVLITVAGPPRQADRAAARGAATPGSEM